MAEILVGTDSTGESNQAADYVFGCQFQAVTTGISTVFRVYSLASGNIKVAVYSDSATAPNTLLWHNSTGVAVASGQWNEISAVGLSITSGTYYWLLVCGDTAGVSSRASSSGGQPRIRRSQSYSGFTFPSTDPGGNTADNYTMMLSVYGNTGWSNIASKNGISQANIASINGVTKANIATLNGIAV